MALENSFEQDMKYGYIDERDRACPPPDFPGAEMMMKDYLFGCITFGGAEGSRRGGSETPVSVQVFLNFPVNIVV